MKTIFRFVATTILLTVSYLSFGQSSSQRHKIQDPAKLQMSLSRAITRGAAALAYCTVAGDDAIHILTDSDYEEFSNHTQREYISLCHYISQMQYVEEVYAEFKKPNGSYLRIVFFAIYTEYLELASDDPRISLARRNRFKQLGVRQMEPIAYQDWERISELCVREYLRPLLK